MNPDQTLSAPAHKSVHPIVYLFLILPFGVVTGYVTVTLSFLFSKQGIAVDHIAALVGASISPLIFTFLWAPFVDTTLSVKKWYLLGNVITCLGLLATGILPIKEGSLPLLTIIVVLATFASSFVNIATNNFMAYDTPPEMKGRAGGYVQAGNLGGAGIGGGAGLWLAQRLPAIWMPGAIIAMACLLCCFALFFVKEPQSTIRTEKVIKSFVNLLKDIWVTLKLRAGYLALFLCFLPLGTGAASNLWAAVAKDWSASADTVALATGVVSGIITALGCLLGGWICDRIDRKLAYILFGLFQAVCAVGMAYCPHTEFMYITWTLIYAVSNGFAYAGYTAFVLEAIGKGAAGTKMSVFSSLSNTPIWYMTLIDGWAHTKWGPVGMLNTEAVFAVIGIALFFGFQATVGVKKNSVIDAV